MINKLIVAACITTPLIIFNSVLPLYLEGQIGWQEAVNAGVPIGIYAFFVWFVNVAIVSKVKVSKKWHLYVPSFLIIFGANYPYRLLARSIFPVSDNFVGDPSYPAISALVFNIIVWVIIELVRSGERQKEAQAMIDKLKIENLEAQKQSLIRQIQPHFLFNTLSTLKSLITEDQKGAEAYTVKLSNFLRYASSSESRDLSPLKKELDFVQNYIELQAIRFEEAFTYGIEVPDKFLQYKVPVFALQTLVENIFKHNYFTNEKPLHFTIMYTEDSLTVWNEKARFKLTERNNTGLFNLNKRYQLTNGSRISISDTEDAFSVTIPLIK